MMNKVLQKSAILVRHNKKLTSKDKKRERNFALMSEVVRQHLEVNRVVRALLQDLNVSLVHLVKAPHLHGKNCTLEFLIAKSMETAKPGL